MMIVHSSRSTQEHRTGFTLLELLVVIAIIVVLMAIVLAVGSALGSATNKSRTETTMEILKGALQEWESKSGRELTWGANGFLVDGTTLNRARYDMQSWNPGPEDPGDFTNLRKHAFLITEMLGTVARSSDIREVLGQIDDEHLISYGRGGIANQAPEWLRAEYIATFEPDINAANWEREWQNGVWAGGLTVLDAWNRPMRFVHAGRKWTPNDVFSGRPPDSDGTIRTPYEDVYGVCVNGRPYFVSGGSDKDFGDAQLELAPGNRAPDPLHAAEDNIYSYEVEKP